MRLWIILWSVLSRFLGVKARIVVAVAAALDVPTDLQGELARGD